MRLSHYFSVLPLEVLLLLSISSINASTINYSPAVFIVNSNTGAGDASGGSSSSSGQGSSSSSGSGSSDSGSGSPGSASSSPASVPFSAATPPACPASHLSCDTIGEPSWCCTDAQHCAFDDGGSVACCPIGNFCHGTVDYGSVGVASVGGSGGGGTASAPDAQSNSGTEIQSGITLTASEGDRIANSTIALWGVLVFLGWVALV